jgi:hypothetical protein
MIEARDSCHANLLSGSRDALNDVEDALLRVLHDLCSGSLLLAGFRRGDLKDVSRELF